MSNILREAEKIVFERSEEHERNYGPFSKSMNEASKIASQLTGKTLTTEDFYKCMIALKLSRLSHRYKRDTYIDLVAYVGALANYQEELELLNNVSGKDITEQYTDKVEEALKHSLNDVCDHFNQENKDQRLCRNCNFSKFMHEQKNKYGNKE